MDERFRPFSGEPFRLDENGGIVAADVAEMDVVGVREWPTVGDAADMAAKFKDMQEALEQYGVTLEAVIEEHKPDEKHLKDIEEFQIGVSILMSDIADRLKHPHQLNVPITTLYYAKLHGVYLEWQRIRTVLREDSSSVEEGFSIDNIVEIGMAADSRRRLRTSASDTPTEPFEDEVICENNLDWIRFKPPKTKRRLTSKTRIGIELD